MASISKFYLHDATTTVGGTLPGGSAVSGSPSVTATGATTNRAMNGTIGTSQTSGALTTLGQTAAQSGFIRRFVSDQLGAQTISAQTITFAGAFSESNNASDFIPTVGLYAWRPSDGSLVGTLLAVGTLTLTEPGTGQTALSATATSTSVTVSSGDILVLEVWRNSGTQVNPTARTNTYFYDGTTEGSTTSNASYLLFTTAVSDNSVSDSFPGDAAVQATVSATLSGTSNVQATVSSTVAADAYAKTTTAGTVTADSSVQFPAPTWVSPADGASVVSTTPLVWASVPSATAAGFHVQLDSTSSAFTSATNYYSSSSSGFEYWDGSAWVTLTSSGMPANKTGNQVRYTPPLTSINATRYRRVRQSY